jgi:hypothetical protein
LQPLEPPWRSRIRAHLARLGKEPIYLVSDASAKQDPAPCSSVFDTNTGNHSVQPILPKI